MHGMRPASHTAPQQFATPRPGVYERLLTDVIKGNLDGYARHDEL